MIYTRTPITPRVGIFWLLFSLFISACFGVFFWAVFKETPLVYQLAYSFINGLAIPPFAGLALLITKKAAPKPRICIIYFTCIIGAAVAVVLAFILLSIPFSTDYLFMFSFTVNATILTIIIGFLYYWERFADTKARIRQEQIRQLAIEKTITQNRMTLIQARLDPAFVFDTLSRILQLLDADLEKAKTMQLALIRYLRLSLSGFESESTSIEKEMEVIRSYFNILEFFPDNGFSCTMDIADDVRRLAIPPMLVRSFVETIAVPRQENPAGLHIHIRAERQNGRLGFEFTGSGEFRQTKEVAIGIGRIRQRIEKTFGEAGRLILDVPTGRPSGMTAFLQIPANLPSVRQAIL